MSTATAQPLENVNMIPVESSQIAAIGHDANTNTLTIQFVGRDETEQGSIYQYANFTFEDFEAFAGADSIGSYFYKNIKKFPEKYPYTKVSG